MKSGIHAALLVLLLSASSCSVGQYTARTQAAINPDGSMTWDSSKNQENLKATFTRKDGKVDSFTIETTATTPEAAIAAFAANMGRLADSLAGLIQKVAPLLEKAAGVAATTGS